MAEADPAQKPKGSVLMTYSGSAPRKPRKMAGTSGSCSCYRFRWHYCWRIRLLVSPCRQSVAPIMPMYIRTSFLSALR